jgi:hypothetical protein
MPTIMVDPEDRGVMSGDPIPGWQPKRVVDCLDEPIPEEGDPCVLDGRPCILFGMWDMAEDSSGDFVNPNLHPLTLIGAPSCLWLIFGSSFVGFMVRADGNRPTNQYQVLAPAGGVASSVYRANSMERAMSCNTGTAARHSLVSS